jgi:hypothetical protein
VYVKTEINIASCYNESTTLSVKLFQIINRHQKQEFAMKVVQKISMGLENQKSSANVEVLDTVISILCSSTFAL